MHTEDISLTDARALIARACTLVHELTDSGTLITMTHDAGNVFGRLATVDGARTWTRATG